MSSDWQRSLVTLTSTVVFVALVAVLYLARSILIPIALAVFIAFVLGPVVARLQRRGLPRALAVILTVGLLLAATVGVGALVTQQVAKLAHALPDRAEAIKAKVTAAKTWLVGDGESRFGQLMDDLGGVIAPKRDTPTVLVEQSGPTLTSQMEAYITPAMTVLGQAAFAFVLTVFMLIKKEDLRNRIIRLLGDGKVTTTTRAVDDASQRASRYLLMQVLVNTGFGLAIAVGLFLLGVDYALLWGFIASVMRYVPYIGTPIGLLPAVLYSFATAPEWGGGWGQPLGVLALFLVLEAICNNVFEPWLYARAWACRGRTDRLRGVLGDPVGPIDLVLSGPIMVCLLVLGGTSGGSSSST